MYQIKDYYIRILTFENIYKYENIEGKGSAKWDGNSIICQLY